MTDRHREGLLAEIAWLRDACRTGVLVSWEVVVVLWAVLDAAERMLAGTAAGTGTGGGSGSGSGSTEAGRGRISEVAAGEAGQGPPGGGSSPGPAGAHDVPDAPLGR